MPTDPFNLQRFVDAQASTWEEVQAELRAGMTRQDTYRVARFQ